MIGEFIDGLQNFHFLQNALITAVVIGVVAGAVGCFIILRGMSLMGDAISHAVLPGVALSFILGIDFFIKKEHLIKIKRNLAEIVVDDKNCLTRLFQVS